MKITRFSALVLMLFLGLLAGPILADIRLPLTPPDSPKEKPTTAEKGEIRPPTLPDDTIPEPPKVAPKVDKEVPMPPPLTENQSSTTGVVMAGGFLALAIVVFGLVVFRSRKAPARPGE